MSATPLLVWMLFAFAQTLIHTENEINTVEVVRGQKAQLTCPYDFTQEDDDWSMTWSALSNPPDQNSTSEEIFYRDAKTEIDQNTSYSDRVSVEVQNGEATLTILDVQLNDDEDITRREFVFEIRQAHEVKACRFVLDVFVAPEPPVMKAVQSSVSVPSQSLTRIASCETRGGYPWRNIIWYRDYIHIHSHDKVAEVKTAGTEESDGSFTVRSDLYYNVTREDKDAQFFCAVKFRIPGGSYRTIRSHTYHMPNQVKTFRSQDVTVTVPTERSYVVPVTVAVLLLVLGGVFFFMFQKGKIRCGRSGEAKVGFLRFTKEQELLPFTNEQELDPSSCDQE